MKTIYIINFGGINVGEAETGMDVGVAFGQFIVPQSDVSMLAKRHPSLDIQKEMEQIFRRLSHRIDDLPIALRAVIESELWRLEQRYKTREPMF